MDRGAPSPLALRPLPHSPNCGGEPAPIRGGARQHLRETIATAARNWFAESSPSRHGGRTAANATASQRAAGRVSEHECRGRAVLVLVLAPVHVPRHSCSNRLYENLASTRTRHLVTVRLSSPSD